MKDDDADTLPIRYVRPKQFLRITGAKWSWTKRKIADGTIRTVKVGGCTFIPVEYLDLEKLA